MALWVRAIGYRDRGAGGTVVALLVQEGDRVITSTHRVVPGQAVSVPVGNLLI